MYMHIDYIKIVKERLIVNGICTAIYINTISGGIVNFGGAIKIAPISITKSTSSGSSTSTSEQPTSGSSGLTGSLQGLNIPF